VSGSEHCFTIVGWPLAVRLGRPFDVGACLANRFDDCLPKKRLVLQCSNGGGWVTLDSKVSGDNGKVNLTDALVSLDHLFREGLPPAAPPRSETGFQSSADRCGRNREPNR
jgi:hypothetical protein